MEHTPLILEGLTVRLDITSCITRITYRVISFKWYVDTQQTYIHLSSHASTSEHIYRHKIYLFIHPCDKNVAKFWQPIQFFSQLSSTRQNHLSVIIIWKLTNSFIYLFIHSFIQLFNCVFIHSCIHSLIHTYTHTQIHFFFYLIIHSFNLSDSQSVSQSFTYVVERLRLNYYLSGLISSVS